MPRNGSGTYTPPSSSWYPAVDGQNAETDDWNSLAADLSDAISDSISADGQTPITANLPMSGYKFTGLAAGSTAGDSVRYEQVNGLFNANTAGVTISSGLLYGLTLSNNGSDATNDIDIAAGIAIDSTNARFMTLAASLTKRLDAAWAVGTNQGGLDTGTIANGTYHVWLIMRSDTGVVDALFSTSASSPTMPSSYDYKRRIGAIIRSGGAILGFSQNGDEFLWKAAAADYSGTPGVSTAVSRTLTTPAGISTIAMINAAAVGGASFDGRAYISSLDQTDETAATRCNVGADSASVAVRSASQLRIRTNTSSQVRTRMVNADASLQLTTVGYIDTRGRLA